MSASAEHLPIEEMIDASVQRERRRCVGLVLAAFGVAKLSGFEGTARILDALANRMEHEDVDE